MALGQGEARRAVAFGSTCSRSPSLLSAPPHYLKACRLRHRERRKSKRAESEYTWKEEGGSGNFHASANRCVSKDAFTAADILRCESHRAVASSEDTWLVFIGSH